MHDKTIDEIYKHLSSGQTGLNSSDIKSRQEKYGKNVIEKQKKQNFFLRFLAQFKNIMVIVLLMSAVISITIALTQQQTYELMEGIVILCIVILNALVGVIQENKAQACLDELNKKSSLHTNVLRDNTIQKIEASEVVVGDIVVLEAGDVVPADLRIIESNGLACDESSLTGESVANEKNNVSIIDKNTSLAERKNIAFSGSLVTNGKAKGIVVSVGNNTEIGKIASMLKSSKKELTPLEKTIAKIGKFISFFVLIICVAIFFLELFYVKDSSFISALMTSVALAVAAIPESLPAVITLIMAMGVQQLAKRKVIIKHLHAVETLGSCEIICTDKTGTLTQNKMKVTETFILNSSNINSFTFEKLINCLYYCNQAYMQNNVIVAEPTEKALFEFALKHTHKHRPTPNKEIPFDSKRKMMTVVNSEVWTKGAYDRILKHCTKILIDDKIVEINSEILKRIEKKNEEMASKSLRVLGFAFKPHNKIESDIELEQDLIFIGLVGMRDEPRKEVKGAIQKCFKAGLTPIMITGDHEITAFSIAKELGIADSIDQVLTGDEINAMNDDEFNKVVSNYKVFARVSPEHKVKIVKGFKQFKKIVAMTGDGVNDAPSLKIADIGVGMGINGTEVAKSVSDMIITDDNFNSIVIAVEEGRKVYNNIQKALQYLMSTNLVEIIGMLFALVFFPNCTFLLPSQMLFINLVTDSLPAFALGVEKVENDLMTSPPRKKNSKILGNEIGVGIVYQAVLQLCIVITMYCVSMRYFSAGVARTMTFYTIIWLQLLHSINCKSSKSLIGQNLINNKTFNICFIVTAIINILVGILPVSRSIFNLSSLSFNQWIWILIASISIIPLCELVKLFLFPQKQNKYIKNRIKNPL